jgi:hypothetical protein
MAARKYRCGSAGRNARSSAGLSRFAGRYSRSGAETHGPNAGQKCGREFACGRSDLALGRSGPGAIADCAARACELWRQQLVDHCTNFVTGFLTYLKRTVLSARDRTENFPVGITAMLYCGTHFRKCVGLLNSDPRQYEMDSSTRRHGDIADQSLAGSPLVRKSGAVVRCSCGHDLRARANLLTRANLLNYRGSIVLVAHRVGCSQRGISHSPKTSPLPDHRWVHWLT